MRLPRRGVGPLLSTAAIAAGVLLLGTEKERSTPSGGTAAIVPVPAAAASVTPAAVASRTRRLRPLRRVYGRGASAVAVVRQQATSGPLPGVLFLHGWGYQRARDYRRWIQHLARRGNVVIVPKYQNGPHSDPKRVRAAMLRGVRTALRHVDIEPGTLVVAGHSAGAAMAADYAAAAHSHGLPRPRAVYAVYPGRRILGTPGIPAADPARIAASTRLLVLAGAGDTIVGQAPARELRAGATSIPKSRRRLVLVKDMRVSDHLAPLRSSKVARSTFWRRLDRLIDAPRGTSSP